MNPRLTFSYVSAAFFALAATGLVIQTDSAVAQQAAEVIEEIVVEAPFVHRQVGGWPRPAPSSKSSNSSGV